MSKHKINVWQWMLSITRNRTQHNRLQNSIDSNIMRLKEKIVPRAFLGFVDIHLAEHCNLNCYSCDNFSQLAKKGYYDIESFSKDIKRLQELTDGCIERFHLMGGEPLLNKNCIQYFRILREHFPNSKIWVITNGILLPKQEENFWLACSKYNIELHPTKYPINIDWDMVKSKCQKYNIVLDFLAMVKNIVLRPV